ncbi:MAG: purine-nucleoside phosphorylase [Cyclonatronaceae bacterium]
MAQTDKLTGLITHLKNKGIPASADAAVILGSGLGGFSSRLQNAISIPYSDIPEFPQSTVEGHSGELIYGMIGTRHVLAFSGRFHHYEGNPFGRTILPVHIASALNTRLLVISNAAGALNSRFSPGDLMLIDDLLHAGFPVLPPGPAHNFRFNADGLIPMVRKAALELGIELKQGTYFYVKGPTYETPAEIRAFKCMGADVVGMSTLPELIEAQRLGMITIGITLVTNMGTGISTVKLDHSDIKDVAEKRKNDFGSLVDRLIRMF